MTLVRRERLSGGLSGRERRSRLGSYGLAYTEDWRHQAACRTADPLLFEECTSDTDPELPVMERTTVSNVRFAEAKKICDSCSVRAECERNGTDHELNDTTRGGVAPWHRGAGAVPVSARGTKPGRGRPPGTKPKPAEEPRRLLAGRRLAVAQCVLDGYQECEGVLALGIGTDSYRNERRSWLLDVTAELPDAVIKFQTKSGKQKIRASNLNGPAWTLAKSECGSVFLVATRKAGTVRTWFLRSHQLGLVRNDVPLLKRYPEELHPGV